MFLKLGLLICIALNSWLAHGEVDLYAVSIAKKLYKYNSGKSWSYKSLPGNILKVSTGYDGSLGVLTTAKRFRFAKNNNDLSSTSSWTLLGSLSDEWAQISVYNSEEVYAVSLSGELMKYTAEDGNWTSVFSDPIKIRNFATRRANDGTKLMSAVDYEKRIWINEGEEWANYQAPVYLQRAAYASDKTLYVLTASGYLYQRVETRFKRFGSYRMYYMDPIDGSYLYVLSRTYRVYKLHTYSNPSPVLLTPSKAKARSISAAEQVDTSVSSAKVAAVNDQVAGVLDKRITYDFDALGKDGVQDDFIDFTDDGFDDVKPDNFDKDGGSDDEEPDDFIEEPVKPVVPKEPKKTVEKPRDDFYAKYAFLGVAYLMGVMSFVLPFCFFLAVGVCFYKFGHTLQRTPQYNKVAFNSTDGDSEQC